MFLSREVPSYTDSNHNKTPDTRFRIMLGFAGLIFGKKTDEFLEERLPRQRGVNRRIFVGRVFYGILGYSVGQILDNIQSS